jgi:hypothetical protein
VIARLVGECWRRNRVLTLVAAGHLLLFVALVPASLLDPTQILGISRWIKPMKFAISIAIFTATMAWLLGYLRESRRAVQAISWVIAVCLTGEIALITMQSARGVPSHFNRATAFDGVVFTTMGVLIGINTLAVIYALIVFSTRPATATPALRTGIRLGLFIFVLASLEGLVMVVHEGHGVGVHDGGPGLPVVNWSTGGGDLRVAHFFGMHALQLLPAIGWLLDRRGVAASPRWVTAFAAGYLGVWVLLLVMALAGRPLIAAVQ